MKKEIITKHKELVFSGVQPSSGQVHLGNYLGAMRRFVTLSAKHETIICLVDLHALTSVQDPDKLSENTLSLAAAYLAIGLNPEQVTIFRQSDVIEVCELCWYLSCFFPLGLLERAHAFKDVKAQNANVNSGVMFYPVLMAADVLLYRGTKVPVGADQKQHVEMMRDVAIRVNNQCGEIFPLPEPLIEESTGVIVGLDGRKMSKRYNNYIGLFEDAKSARKKIMSIVTDSKSVEDKKDPETCNVFKLYKLLATDQEVNALAERYRAGGMGYGHAKEELFQVYERTFGPMREKYNDWMSKPEELKVILAAGAKKARAVAHHTMALLRGKLGLGEIL
ncbi:tryptophan--tRNA ligase [bacterium]|nr:tryptophan--tRNA ligase [bacterium]